MLDLLRLGRQAGIREVLVKVWHTQSRLRQ